MLDEPFRPDWTSPPGDTIRDVLTERGVSFEDFAKQMGMERQNVVRLVNGDLSITMGTAQKLATVIGGSMLFWVTRESQYRQDLARLEAR